jgi:glucose-1-phosphate thymidylyltransferase
MRPMKGIILAGGTGTRLFPLTKVTNKHLLPVGKVPMVYHPLFKLIEAGIEEILIVSGLEHLGDMARLLGSGADFSVRITYRAQERSGGIAEALQLAEGFCAGDPMVVLLGDNVFEDRLTPHLEAFREKPEGAMILLSEVDHPERFGIAEVEARSVVSIEEKPQQPKSSLCVTGIYLYDTQVFSFIRTLRHSERGELEITDVNKAYLSRGQLRYALLEGWWTDAGTPESLLKANQLAYSMPLYRKGEGK